MSIALSSIQIASVNMAGKRFDSSPQRASMMFHGDKAPTAFVEVKILGKSTREAYENLTARICDIMKEEIGVSPEYCYVKFEEITNWGYNGFLF